MKTAKSIFQSKTVWFAIATLWAALFPILKVCAEQTRQPTPVEYLQMVTILITTGGGVASRYAASTLIYTPDGLPGRSLGDIPTATSEET